MELTRTALPGVSVPPGVVVTTSVYRAAVVGALGLRFSPDSPAALAAGRRAVLDSARLPDDCVAALAAFVRPGVAYAVRSSATVEDGAAASMAGLAETFLFVAPADVPRRVVECWASLWTERVGSYLSDQVSDGANPLMAVVVQEMVDAAAAGVLFTLHPSRGTDNFMSVEAVWGAGEALVSGAVTPASLCVDWVAGTVQRENEAHVQAIKLCRAAAAGREGLEERPTTAAERASPPLLRDKAAALWQLVECGRQIASHYGHPQDVEWVVGAEDQRIYIVQTRPVTRFAVSHLREERFFSGFAFKSVLAMSLSSLTGYYCSRVYGNSKPLPEHEATRQIYGIAYVNNRLTKLPHVAVPLEVVESYTHHAHRMEPLLFRVVGAVSAVPTPQLFQLTVALLQERIELAFMSFSTGSECRALERGGVDVSSAGCSRPESAQHVVDLQALARRLAAEAPDALQLLVKERFEEFSQHTFFAAAVVPYLRAYFFFCDCDEDILEERWLDNPMCVLRMLRLLVVGGGPVTASSQPQPSPPPPQATDARTRRFLGYLRAKDEIHECYLRGNFFLCKLLQECNRRLQLPQDAIFFASHQTLTAALLGGKSEAAELEKEIVRHRSVREMFRNFDRPMYLTRGMPSFSAESSQQEERRRDGTRVLSGIGGSAGVATGVTRVCLTLQEATSTLQRGEVLVTSMTSPAWTPLFPMLGGVITEHGGRLSHAAVVARECGLPAVLGLERVAQLLPTGTMVQIDGATGEVVVLGRSVGVAQAAASKNDEDDEEEEVADLSRSREELVLSRNA